MQDRYAGDIGDYIKLSLLRAIAGIDRTLGVAWYLVGNETHNADGKHVSYTQNPRVWREFDPEVFDALRKLVLADRSVAAIERANLISNATFASERLPTSPTSVSRRQERDDWFSRQRHKLQGCDVIFADPDNGLEPKGFSVSRASACKSISWPEVGALAKSSSVLVYHHQTRFKGGHTAEIQDIFSRFLAKGLPIAGALRASPGSARAFFLVTRDVELVKRAREFAAHWAPHVSWFGA